VNDCGLVIDDCGFVDWGLRIEIVDCGLRFWIETGDCGLNAPITNPQSSINNLNPQSTISIASPQSQSTIEKSAVIIPQSVLRSSR
jgi:hypothetical protein